jgi:hypothetical protein
MRLRFGQEASQRWLRGSLRELENETDKKKDCHSLTTRLLVSLAHLRVAASRRQAGEVRAASLSETE